MIRERAIQVEPRPQLRVGDRVRFGATKQRWAVQAVTDQGRFAILTKPFNAQRTVLYTIVDFDRGVRGKDNFHGLGYETPEDIAEALHGLQHTEDDDRTCEGDWCIGGVEVSYRSGNHIRLDFVSINDEPTEWNGQPALEAAR